VEEAGAEAVESYKDLRVPAHLVERAFTTVPEFLEVEASLEEDIELAMNQLLKWRHGSELDQEVFPPPPGMTIPVTSTWGSAG
jgi:hypothetical protein